jgi:transposase
VLGQQLAVEIGDLQFERVELRRQHRLRRLGHGGIVARSLDQGIGIAQTFAEGRRSWTLDKKREITAERLGSELTPSEVARKHAIGSGQLYTWRRQLLSKSGAVIERAMPRFAEVDLALASPGASAPMPTSGPAPSAPIRTGGMIEIMLPNGVSLRVDAEVDGRMLRRVLDALHGR